MIGNVYQPVRTLKLRGKKGTRTRTRRKEEEEKEEEEEEEEEVNFKQDCCNYNDETIQQRTNESY